MGHRILRTEQDVEAYCLFLRNATLPRTVEDHVGADRSLDQNALQFLWASEAARQRGDCTIEEVRREWKLRYGVPILREESPAFRDLYDRMIKGLPYEMKLRAMDLIPVTSKMTVRQMVRYLDDVQRENAILGIRLTDPDPDLASYQARYRQKIAA